MMTIQQEIYYIIFSIKNITNLFAQIYQDKLIHSIPQQINFAGKFEGVDGATMFFIVEKQQKTILNFSLDLLIVTEQYK